MSAAYLKGRVQKATAPDAFTSNYGMEDFSHDSAKN